MGMKMVGMMRKVGMKMVGMMGRKQDGDDEDDGVEDGGDDGGGVEMKMVRTVGMEMRWRQRQWGWR